MANLNVKYAGLELKNPIIAGASSMSSDLQHLLGIEKSGAAAVVFKTLFEEQIHLEAAQFEDQVEESGELHAEMTSLMPKLRHAGPDVHLVNLRKAKEKLSIPVIGSLNCLENATWLEYALKMEQTGVDALELNFYFVPGDFDRDGSAIESEKVALVKLLKSKIKVPVTVKLSQFYSNPLNFIKQMSDAGADGIVIFNRMFEPDLSVESFKHITPYYLSAHGDYRVALRYAGLLYGKVGASVCGNTGIYEGTDVAKMILAGADAVQVVSTLYKHKVEHIGTMLNDLSTWMDEHKFESISDFQGKLSRKNVKDPFVYRRGQYIDLLLNSDTLLR